MLQSLSDIQSKEPLFRYRFETAGLVNSLKNVWWASPDWLRDYEQYGVVPGVAIDGKGLANRFNLPLFTLTGRTNYGRTRLFAMGFLQGENGWSVRWFLNNFKSAVTMSPKFVTMDGSYSNISATRAVSPTSAILLDYWHLNKNQKRNVAAYLTSKWKTSLMEEMSGDLFTMRRSSTKEKFMTGRMAFEETYFGYREADDVPNQQSGAIAGEHADTTTAPRPVETRTETGMILRYTVDPAMKSEGSTERNVTEVADPRPRWFKLLYVVEAELVVTCFNRTERGVRFDFQGSGFCESMNSLYKRFVLPGGVYISRMSCNRRRAYDKMKYRQRGEDERYSASNVRKFHCSGLFDS